MAGVDPRLSWDRFAFEPLPPVKHPNARDWTKPWEPLDPEYLAKTQQIIHGILDEIEQARRALPQPPPGWAWSPEVVDKHFQSHEEERNSITYRWTLVETYRWVLVEDRLTGDERNHS